MTVACNVSSCFEQIAKMNYWYALSICNENDYINIIVTSFTDNFFILFITYTCDIKMTTLASKCSITDRKSKSPALFKVSVKKKKSLILSNKGVPSFLSLGL